MAELIPLAPRWNRAYSLVRSFIKDRGINWLPVDLFEIYKSEKWLIATAEYGRKSFPEFNWGNFYRDEIDAVTYKKQGHYLTIYNERFPTERIRWTLAHEIGHIVLGHLNDFEETKIFRSGLTEEKYNVLELEAHAFASELLTPSVPLLACRITESEGIQKICRISKEAALKRQITLKKRRSVGIPVSEAKFYINQFRPFLNQRVCKNCKHYFIISGAKYCPVCGSQSIEWGENKMVYEGFQLDSKSKAIICPRCDNEEIHPEHSRCKICGTFLINQCAGEKDSDLNGNAYYTKEPCNTPAEGNARFCVSCGCITSFYEQGILKSWEKENEKARATKKSDRGLKFLR